eukprot:TRINITY_DN55378_c1_g1_i1.p1 TRINITY_DN55378_c1_g1~~TRINITY_DN55378_c1_g1_i1.p1  ORF type:complete len:358 (+),score=119.86 TRINITY_DN55378_c1_g1_i1:54-1127(+)
MALAAALRLLLLAAALVLPSLCVVQRSLVSAASSSGAAAQLQLSTSAVRAELEELSDAYELAEDDPSTATYRKLRSRVQNVQKKIRLQQLQNIKVLAKQREELQRRLAEQERSNANLDAKRLKLTASVAALRGDTTRLRGEAQRLLEANGRLQADAKVMKHNLTVYGEVVDKFIAEQEARLDEKSPELAALRARRAQDASSAHDAEIRRALGLVPGKGSALLQLARAAPVSPAMKQQRSEDADAEEEMAEASPAVPSKELIDTVMGAVEKMTQEQREESEVLQKAFTKDYDAGQDRNALLTKQVAELKKTKASLAERKDRLQASISYLEKRHAEMLDQTHHLRNFLLYSVGQGGSGH